MPLKRSPIPASVLLAFAGLTVAGAARAQSSGFAVDRFDPSERGSEWFALDSLDFRGQFRPAVGLVGDYAYHPLVLSNAAGTKTADLVENQVVVHAGASFVIWERLRLAIDVPVQVYADGQNAIVGATTYDSPTSAVSFGDIRFGADLRLLGHYGGYFTLAVGGNVFVPSGSQGSFAGDGAVRLLGHVMAAGDVGPFVYALKVGVLYRNDTENYFQTTVGNEFQYAASAGLRVADKRFVIGPELFGGTVIQGNTKNTAPVEGLLGAHYTLTNGLRLGAGAGFGFNEGYGSPGTRVLANIEWAPPVDVAPKDRDHDGVPDPVDACPDVPGVHTDDPATNGCPPERDHDGVIEAEDACPDVPGIKTDDPKTNGCPADRDHDGVPDAVDACPDVAGDPSDDPKLNGCPPDRDKDGIIDAEDACPDVPGIKTNDPKTNGCPDPDRDHDGILNAVDACPDEAGPPNADPAKNGCPRAAIRGSKITIIDQVRFKTASAEILPGRDSEDILEAVLEVLKAHPEIHHVVIEGHTDNRGPLAYNNKLRAGRAASVMAWLNAHGIEMSRMSSIGYGPSRPILDNTTAAGRTANRRVDFQIEPDNK